MEALLAKLLCYRRQQQTRRQRALLEAEAAGGGGGGPSGVAGRRGPQLIAMSATLPNVQTLGE